MPEPAADLAQVVTADCGAGGGGVARTAAQAAVGEPAPPGEVPRFPTVVTVGAGQESDFQDSPDALADLKFPA